MQHRCKIRSGLLLLLCLLCQACQLHPWADDFVKKISDEKDLVGTYRVDADSLRREINVEPAGGKLERLVLRDDMEVTLNPDHSAHFTNLPDEMTKDATSYGFCRLTGTGTWKLYKNEFVTVDLLPDSNASPSCNGPVSFHLFGSKPPYKLHITIGDPDLGQAIQFEKIR